MSCYLYVISEGEHGPVKIGISANPGARLNELQTGNPRKLSLAWKRLFKSRKAARLAERAAHQFIGDCALEGEWFDFEPSHSAAAVMACIEEVGS